MNIVFVLPRAGSRPIGGFKVVYEYANELARRGHHVRVLHPALMRTRKHYSRIKFYLKSYARYLKGIAHNSWRPVNWFSVDPRVEMCWVRAISTNAFKAADVVVATQWGTAEEIAALPNYGERRAYLIQHLETWDGPEDRVRATWRLPFAKIVIANWLRDVAHEMGEESVYIANGLDFNQFNCVVPIQNRTKSIAMMVHPADWKGTADGLKAIAIAKKSHPTLTAELFGVDPRPDSLPDWIAYHRRPSQEALKLIYNNAAIFIAPSWSEGWPLPPAEAMMCGAAVAGTDIGGHREYMVHRETAMLSPPNQPQLLAGNLLRLLEDDELRYSIAHSGNVFIQKFTWTTAADKLEQMFFNLSTKRQPDLQLAK